MSLFRQKKRRFRIKRLIYPLLSIVLVFLVMASIGANSNDDLMESPVYQPMGETNQQQMSLLQDNHTYAVTKKLIYICGEETEDLGMMTGTEVHKLLEEHEGLKITWGADGQAVIEESIEDLSPACKGNVYFSMDTQGNLTLFEGDPEANKVLQTFFQINIDYLESSLPRQTIQSLYEGIRINDYAEYNSVLSTFAGYAVEAKAQ